MRAWKYRIYPSKRQEKGLNFNLYECKNLWNSLLEYTKAYYKETRKFPTRKCLYLLSKETSLFSQVAQNVADRLIKSLHPCIGISMRQEIYSIELPQDLGDVKLVEKKSLLIIKIMGKYLQ